MRLWSVSSVMIISKRNFSNFSASMRRWTKLFMSLKNWVNWISVMINNCIIFWLMEMKSIRETKKLRKKRKMIFMRYMKYNDAIVRSKFMCFCGIWTIIIVFFGDLSYQTFFYFIPLYLFLLTFISNFEITT